MSFEPRDYAFVGVYFTISQSSVHRAKEAYRHRRRSDQCECRPLAVPASYRLRLQNSCLSLSVYKDGQLGPLSPSSGVDLTRTIEMDRDAF